MGLPEVAEYARNFAVMVRVQGPDPKGLKMRNHAFHHYNSGKTTLSASGMLLQLFSEGAISASGGNGEPSDTVLVLTAASIIEPFVMQQYRGNTFKGETRMVPGVQIEILLESKTVMGGNADALPWVPVELLKMVNIPLSSAAVQSLIEASYGSLESGWEVGWSLASHNRGTQHIMDSSSAQVGQSSFQSRWPILRTQLSNPNLMGQSATRIAVLAIPSNFSMKLPKLKTSVPKRGDLLLAMGSPFGILSPLHFFNNVSVGSISNSYPSSSPERSLLMADIRCLPGMEGSPVFSEDAQFIGILTRPLRQKTSGTEIQMVIPWEAIASVCRDLLQVNVHVTSKGINHKNGSLNAAWNMTPKGHSKEIFTDLNKQTHSDYQLSPVEKATASICLITTDDGSWASGVLLNKQGLVLTNAHLLEPWRFGRTAAKGDWGKTSPTDESVSVKLETCSSEKPIQRNIRVRLDCMDPWMWTDASVIHISRGPLDVALLQLEIAPEQLCTIVMDVDRPSPGSKAYVIGHGLFGPRCDFLPSACLGVISKVIEAKTSPEDRSHYLTLCEQFPAMLETTAAVHPGSSGGAVVNSDGHMIGLVTSNAKHGGGTVIPHLNFSIPCAALMPILKFSRDMQDLTVLEELDKPDEHLSSVWALVPPLYPKPEPLSDIPQFPAEDNKKDTKGSRFARFIGERKELQKTTAQPGVGRSFGNELVLSKL